MTLKSLGFKQIKKKKKTFLEKLHWNSILFRNILVLESSFKWDLDIQNII